MGGDIVFFGRVLLLANGIAASNDALNAPQQNASRPGIPIEQIAKDAGIVAASFDNSLRIIGRICAASLLLSICGLLFYFRKKIKSFVGPYCAVLADACRCRRLRRCLPHLINLMPCFSSRDCGLHGLADTKSMLLITLLGATHIKEQMDFYIEAWTEPKEAAPKSSRTHHRVIGQVDLGMEVLEFDWFGDEDEVVVQAVTVTPQGGKQAVLGEARLSVDELSKYAKESHDHPSDIRKGSRTFEMGPPAKQKLEPDALTMMMLKKANAALGSNLADEKEVEKMRGEIHELKTKLARTNGRTNGVQDADPEAPAPVMSIAMHFQIVGKRSAAFNFEATGIAPRSHQYQRLAQDSEYLIGTSERS